MRAICSLRSRAGIIHFLFVASASFVSFVYFYDTVHPSLFYAQVGGTATKKSTVTVHDNEESKDLELLDGRPKFWFPPDEMNWTQWNEDSSNKFIFVHVGKAAGSTLFCALVNGKHKTCKGWNTAPQKQNRQIVPLYAIHFGTRCHMGGCSRTSSSGDNETVVSSDNESHNIVSNYTVALVSLRHPVKRLISAFYYEKTEFWMRKKYKKFHYCFGRQKVDVLLRALSPSPPSETNATKKDQDCWRVAQRVVSGKEIKYPSHMTYNYGYYESCLVPKPEPFAETKGLSHHHHILGIRQEHLDQDLLYLDRFLSTGDANYGTVVTQVAKAKKINQGRSKSLYTNFTRQELNNVCRALCNETQSYKRLLLRAENLNSNMIQQSIIELQEICPDETLEPRDCSNV